MAIKVKHHDIEFGVGDRIRVTQMIKEGDKNRQQIFDGMVIGIKGSQENISFVVRKIGEQQIGIEKIYPLSSPTITNIEVVRSGLRGVRKAKLYYIRGESKREIEKIYSHSLKRQESNKSLPKTSKKSH